MDTSDKWPELHLLLACQLRKTTFRFAFPPMFDALVVRFSDVKDFSAILLPKEVHGTFGVLCKLVGKSPIQFNRLSWCFPKLCSALHFASPANFL